MGSLKVFFLIIIIIAVGAVIYSASQNKISPNDSKTATSTPQSSFFDFLKPTPAAKKIVKPTATKQTQPAASQKTTPTSSVYLSDVPDSQIPLGFKREQLSLNFKKIKISSASYSSSGSAPSQIRIYSYLNDKNKTINISGWKIKSNLRELIIPQAINIYDPSGLSAESDILFGDNHNLNIYSNTSAINKNFRLNKCIGYLENFYSFNPSLSQSCPAIYKSRSEIAGFAGYCQTYIMSLGSCKLPDTAYYNSLPGTDEGNACRNYLSKINYASCFQEHQKEEDFLSREWRVWINQNTLFDPQHDRLLLFDKDNLLVDEYIY